MQACPTIRRMALLLISLAALAGSHPLLAQSQAPAAGNPFGDVKSIALSENQVERFLSASKDFHDIDFEFDNPKPGQVPSLNNWSSQIDSDPNARAIISRHGFPSALRFAQIAYSLGLAVGALEMQKNSAEFDQIRSQLEAMKDQLPPETYAQMEQQMLGALRMFEDQPAGNLELARKYRPQIEALSRD